MKQRLIIALREYRLAWLIPLGLAGALLTILIPTSRSAMLGGACATLWMWLGTRNYIFHRGAQELKWSFMDSLVIVLLGMFGAGWIFINVRLLCLTSIAKSANCTNLDINIALVGIFGCQIIAIVLALLNARKDWINLSIKNKHTHSQDVQ